jgi:hypothetical protein
MSNPYGQQPGGWSQPGQPGGYPPQQQPGQPGGWSQPGQPGYPPQQQPAGWPQQQGGYPPQQQQQPGGWPQQGFAPAPPAQKKRGPGLIILVVVLVVLIGGGVGGFLLLRNSSNPGGLGFDRHGLPSSVPLPNNISFDSTQTVTNTDQDTQITTAGSQWIWLVNGQKAAAVAQFYKDNLAAKGWANPHDFPASSNGDQTVIGCQGSQILLVGASDNKDDISDKQGNVVRTVKAPAGGSVLEIDIVTTSSQEAQAFLCTGQLPGLPTP